MHLNKTFGSKQHTFRNEENMKEIVIMIGNIGTGKSTRALELAHKGYVIINADAITTMIGGGDYTLYDIKKKLIYKDAEYHIANISLQNNFSVVIDNTNMSKKTRARWVELGIKHEAYIVACNYGIGSKSSLNRRLKEPKGISKEQWISVHDKFQKEYDPPEFSEGFNIIFKRKGAKVK